ncbi:MAG: hypothetical protein K1X55_02160 [Chitinophagales bacterium]|nr:hypothetical protein [Chitinophagales bacterium]
MKILSLLFLLLAFNNVKSQDYMDKIVEKACDCVSDIDKNGENYTMKLGLCMIEASMPYAKQIKKDYGIEMIGIHGKDAQKLGQILGMKMAIKCPDALIEASQEVLEDDKVNIYGDVENTLSNESVTGVINDIKEETFVTISIKDENGKISKYIWLTYVDCEEDFLTNYKDYLGEKVTIKFDVQEFFDPKIQEYRNYNVITSLTSE